MLVWMKRPVGVLECSKVFCYIIGQVFAFAILALWVTSTLAEPLTLRAESSKPEFEPCGLCRQLPSPEKHDPGVEDL
jgi:hypothetical protein